VLPASWSIATLAKVTTAPKKVDPITTGRQSIRYLEISGIDGDRHAVTSAESVASSTAPSRCRQPLRSGDTVFSTVRPYLERIAFIDDSLNDEFASTGFCVLRPTADLDPRYLFHFASSPLLLDQVLPLQKGVSYPAVLDKEVRGATIPVPPLDEQRRIVAILEDHLSRLDAASTSLGVTLRKIEAWRDAEVDAALWTYGVDTAPISLLLREPMRNGRSDRAAPDGRGTRTLTITAVTKNDFAEDNTKITLTSEAAAAGLWLEPGDIFVQRSNTPELVGSASRYEGPRDWAIFPDLLIRLRADESMVTSEYLVAALRSRRVHRALRAKAKGLAGSMPKIDQGAIGGTEVPTVPLPAQAAIVARLKEVDDSAQRFIATAEESRRRAAALRRSLLAAAFRGDLTAAGSVA